MNLKVKIKRMDPDAIIPSYAHLGDGALDLTAISMDYDDSKSQVIYDTGLAFELPKNHVGLLFPRSSIYKTGCRLSNSVGVLDSTFRGSVKFIFDSSSVDQYQVGDRIGQILIVPYPTIEFEVVNELENSERGTGGFGSSGA